MKRLDTPIRRAAAYISRRSCADGTVAGCETINSINERGNIGPIEGDYEQAALKIAVFGDSWAAFHVDGMTWTDIFQREMT